MKQILFMTCFLHFASANAMPTKILHSRVETLSCREALSESDEVYIEARHFQTPDKPTFDPTPEEDFAEMLASQSYYYNLVKIGLNNVLVKINIALTPELLTRLSLNQQLSQDSKRNATDQIIDKGAMVEVVMGDNLKLRLRGADVRVNFKTGRIMQISWLGKNDDVLEMTNLESKKGKSSNAQLYLQIENLVYKIGGQSIGGLNIRVPLIQGTASED